MSVSIGKMKTIFSVHANEQYSEDEMFHNNSTIFTYVRMYKVFKFYLTEKLL